MPLVKIDLIKGTRKPEEIKQLADIVQQVMLGHFNAPERDRYQVRVQCLLHSPLHIGIKGCMILTTTDNHPTRTLRTHLRRHKPRLHPEQPVNHHPNLPAGQELPEETRHLQSAL